MKDIKRLLPYMTKYKLKLNLSIFLTILYTFARSAQPFLIGLIISELVANVLGNTPINLHYIMIITIIIAVCGITDAISDYCANYFLIDVIQKGMYDIRSDIQKKLNKLPVSFFDTHKQGDILGRITTDVDVVSVALQQGIIKIFAAFLTLFFSIVFMFIRSTFFGLLALIIFPLVYIIYRKLFQRAQPKFMKLQNELGRLNSFTTETFTSHDVVQLFNQEDHMQEKFNEITESIQETGFKSNFNSSVINPLLSSILNLAYILIFLVMGITVLRNPLVIGGFVLSAALDIGALQSFIQYIWQFSSPIRDITQLSNVIQAAIASLARVLELLDAKEEKQQVDNPDINLSDMTGQVTFNHVKFGYSPDKILMQDVNIDIAPGSMVAVVGPTGAGKTTLINLLMRFYDINAGSICIDSVDIKTMSKPQERSLFGMVLQDPWLYAASVADNIAFGTDNAERAQIIAAAKIANVDHYIRTLPEGYETFINQESSNVSQGQKQLITIARALVGDPKILILDEATSSIDTRLELMIQSAMEKAMENRTSFIIAHRLSTIRNADLILVMNQGSIVEHGTHDDLLLRDGMYSSIYQSQFDS